VTRVLTPDHCDLSELAMDAREGRIIAFPTDTVYGLGTTALDPKAWSRLFDIKARPRSKSLPVLLHRLQEINRWAVWTPLARTFALRCWPGPLTMVLRPKKEGERLPSSEDGKVAFRVPKCPLLLDLIKASGVPWATTSANLSGQPAAVDGAAVVRRFSGKIDSILDAGKIKGPFAGKESTVVDVSGEREIILREGAIPAIRLR